MGSYKNSPYRFGSPGNRAAVWGFLVQSARSLGGAYELLSSGGGTFLAHLGGVKDMGSTHVPWRAPC